MDNLDDQIKRAQLEKELAEIEKIKSEQKKVTIEADKISKENVRRWWHKERSLQNLTTLFAGFLGIGILIFYFNFYIKPSAEIKIQKKEFELIDKEKELRIISASLEDRENQLKLLAKEITKRDSLVSAKEKAISALNNYKSNLEKALNSVKKQLSDCGIDYKNLMQNLSLSENDKNAIVEYNKNLFQNYTFELNQLKNELKIKDSIIFELYNSEPEKNVKSFNFFPGFKIEREGHRYYKQELIK